ncbi:patatin-like phospholipase family protein [Allobranchiibius sp. GilTou38]|uniref:patatin-like phospholipase family protein n=1 Tax=Allobranchiibius sp. GilTou38 TaxID=2815210 RepID=UPI003260B662
MNPSGASPTCAFVLGGGGVLGATQIGMLRALLERDIRPDLVVGTSIGAVNGAAIAADPGEAALERLTELWSSMSVLPSLQDALPRPRLRVPGRRADSDSSESRSRRRVPRTHLSPAGPFLRLIRDNLPVANIEDMQVPFQCVAANLERSVAHWFSEGPAAPAIMASCAVPGLFPPIEIDGKHYWDGGLVHSIPVSRAIALGATRIYVMHVGRVEQQLRLPRWPWEVASVTFEIARRHRYVEEMANIPPGIEVHELPSGAEDAPMVSLLHRNPAYITGRIAAAYTSSSAYLASVDAG